jgi:hypothetical protein
MASINGPMSDDDWQARCDMDTLVRAKQITDDPKRVGRAKDYAKRQAREAGEAVEALNGGDGDVMSKGYRKLG